MGPSSPLYDSFIEVCRNRHTTRAFDDDMPVPAEHIDMVLEAARLAPSGANSQPWHFVVVTDPDVKKTMSEFFVAESTKRARMGMKFPTPNFRPLATAPAIIVVVADFRWTKAFPMLGDGSELDERYKENAERILLQSVAAATMSAQLAATAMGYGMWWVTAIGQEDAQNALRPVLGVPDDLEILDIIVFGKPAKEQLRRWKKPIDDIRSWGTYNMDAYMSDDAIDTWIKETRHKAMHRDESQVETQVEN